MYKVLPRSFFLREDVILIARQLIGKYVVSKFGGRITSGMITETEAYEGITDKASHAYGGRFTRRTEIMYREGGIAYVYLCYGVHSLFNIVTHKKGIPHAVLIRGILPDDGQEIMKERIGKSELQMNTGNGPGKVTRLLGIHHSHSGIDLCKHSSDKLKDAIWIEDRGFVLGHQEIITTPRIGIDYTGEDAKLPYRFVLRNISGQQIRG